MFKKGKEKVCALLKDEKGMEMIQVAILIGIAVVIGVVFKDKISVFIDQIFNGLSTKDFSNT